MVTPAKENNGENREGGTRMSSYATWKKSKLIEHIEAYSHGMHELAGEVMKKNAEISRLKMRLEGIDEFRDMLHGS